MISCRSTPQKLTTDWVLAKYLELCAIKINSIQGRQRPFVCFVRLSCWPESFCRFQCKLWWQFESLGGIRAIFCSLLFVQRLRPTCFEIKKKMLNNCLYQRLFLDLIPCPSSEINKNRNKLCVYLYIYVFMFLCIYVFLYICIYVFMYICIYVFMYLTLNSTHYQLMSICK